MKKKQPSIFKSKKLDHKRKVIKIKTHLLFTRNISVREWYRIQTESENFLNFLNLCKGNLEIDIGRNVKVWI